MSMFRAVLLLVLVVAALLALPAAPASAGWNDGGPRCSWHHGTCIH